ncbi:MAG: M15 family metallopeptidase, partial [Treponema sp.]|nr:M15 family metallopeptidase [Treponema sp.]
LERKEELDRQQRKLYLMLFGEETKPANKAENRMTYSQFVTALKTLFPSPTPELALPVNEKQAVSQETILALYHSALYQESGAFTGEDVTASLGVLNVWLEKEEAKSQEKLAEEESRLKNIQRNAAAEYGAFLGAEQEIPEEMRERLRNYARLAADQSLSVVERNNAAAAYDALFAEIRPASEELRGIVKAMAEKAWGAGTWNSKSASLALAEFRGDLFNTLIFYSRDNEEYSQKALEDLENAAVAAIDKGALSPLDVKEHEWKLLREDWTKQYNRWAEQSAEILRLSKNEWEKARERLNEGYYEWRNRFSGEYNAKNAEWELNYLGFVMAKRDWVEEQYLRAEEAGNGETLERLGMETEEAIAEALAELAILRMSRDDMDLGGYLEILLTDTMLPELLAHAGNLENRGGIVLAPVGPGSRRSQEAASLAAAEKTLGEINEDIRKAAANLAALQSLKRLEEIKRQILSSIEEGNSDTWEWERKMVTEGGYSTDGIISREIATDASLFSVKTERQTVHRYQYYTAPEPYTHVDLSPLSVAALDPETVILMVAQAEQDLKEWGAELLSTKARDGREGKMEAHIGYAPKFKDEPNLNSSALANVQEMGSGEIGLIMLDYQWNSMLARRGIAEMAKPVYDQKFWINTSDSIFLEPPTARGVADMGMQIVAGMAMSAANAVSGESGAGMAVYAGVNMIDDLLFGVTDLAGGYKSPEEVGRDLGRKSLMTAAGAVTGAALGGLGITEKVSGAVTRNLGEGFWGSMANTAAVSTVNGLQSFAGGTVTSALSAAYWDGDGSLGWSWDLFQEGFKGTLANTVSGITGSMASGLLGQLNLGTNGVLAGGFNQLQKLDMAQMNKFLGDMAANAVSYQMTGSASFNILRYSKNFKDTYYSTGLLELRVGDEGISARLGTGGMDASLGAIGSTLKGMVNWGLSGGSEIAARRDGVKNAATALRSQWGYGDGEAKDRLLSILVGSTRLARGDEKAEEDAETITGQNGRIELLNRYQDEMSHGEQLLMGVVLQHEAYRDSMVSADNFLETRDAVSAHTEMAIRMLLGGESLAFNDNMVRDLVAYVNAGGDAGKFNAYVDETYDSSGDYWLLKTDGTIVDDNSPDLHWEAVVKKNKAGKDYYKTIWYAGKGMSKEESLVALLGGKERALQLLQGNDVSGADGVSGQSIGELILKNYLGENDVLSLAYSQFDIKGVTGKDWQAIYDSYTAHETFFNNNSWISGREDLLTRANLGDKVTTKLEYYSLLFDLLTKKLALSGTAYENDPLAYLETNTEIVQFGGMGSVRVNSAIAPDLSKALEATKSQGGAIPAISGGLSIRLINNDTLDKLELSNHATGMAVDFDAANNRQYFIGTYARNNPEFNNYLKSRDISLSAATAAGYDANQKLAKAFDGYETYLEGRKDFYMREAGYQLYLISNQLYPLVDFAALDSATERFNYYNNLLKDINLIPKLSFSMDKVFVENMRNHFEWGGSWKYQKDYMHFEAKR